MFPFGMLEGPTHPIRSPLGFFIGKLFFLGLLLMMAAMLPHRRLPPKTHP